MTIVQADWSDILTVLHESHKIWSPGLKRDEYHDYIWRQMNHTWARQYYKFIVLKKEGRIFASCKLYTVSLCARGKTYKFAGIGAIYTQMQYREQGHATSLINEVIEICRDSGYDGTLLFSDIDPDFYSKFGFMEFGSADFSVSFLKRRIGERETPDITFVQRHHIPTMMAIYSKWQRTQPFGFERSELYMDYKLERERFLADHSHLAWPSLEVTFADENGIPSAYAITERGGNNLRILEIVGSQSARIKLWSTLFEQARKAGIYKVRGWESVAADLFPGFRIQDVLSESLLETEQFGPLQCDQREWGRPMILPFDEGLEDWASYFPCPLLELDHL